MFGVTQLYPSHNMVTATEYTSKLFWYFHVEPDGDDDCLWMNHY